MLGKSFSGLFKTVYEALNVNKKATITLRMMKVKRCLNLRRVDSTKGTVDYERKKENFKIEWNLRKTFTAILAIIHSR